MDSTPPTPTTRTFPSAPVLRKFWEGRTFGMLLGETELREEGGREGGRKERKEGRRGRKGGEKGKRGRRREQKVKRIR